MSLANNLYYASVEAGKLERRLDGVAEIIRELDQLPADHEPEVEDLWEALRRIETLSEGDS